MKLWVLALMCAVFSLLLGANVAADEFVDDFNRPDSPTVGNGWLDTIGNIGGNLATINGQVSPPAADITAGIYRPFDSSVPVTISATLTDMNGFGGIPYRYDRTLTIRNDGILGDGYGVGFYRADASFDNSSIRIFDNQSLIQEIPSSFQFTSSIKTQFTIKPDGSIAGNVSDPNNTNSLFTFNFGARAIQSQGNNFSYSTGAADPRSGSVILPRLDNLAVTSDTPVRPRTALLAVGVSWPDAVVNSQMVSGLKGAACAQLVASGFEHFVGKQNETVVSLQGTASGNLALLQQNISWMVDSSNPNHLVKGDTAVFYLGTHGDYADRTTTVSIAGHDPLVNAQYSTTDYSLRKATTADGEVALGLSNGQRDVLADDDLAEMFKSNSWKDVKKLFLMDSCFSGRFIGPAPYDLSSLPNAAVITSANAADFGWYDGATGLSRFASALSDTLLAYDVSGATVNAGAIFDGIQVYAKTPALGYITDFQDDWFRGGEVPAFQPDSSIGTDFDWSVSVPEPRTNGVFLLIILTFGLYRRSRKQRSF